ncbi:adaptor protein MecA [Ornithinibacillus gellani]|uniref:adaptor protein MecA n=1 Tax=Ornithinibacillus gellani TaxID=2293253 RepID=UPI000F4892F2|nr:adaptor protein MecA [Ornithinibacillus gellani]TQS75807.1 adaptor protein MecA [Ornithinibacillus gellani]
MEIERINENTVKFYISYVDIEDRGFEREEIWYNRERSEQLFWQMMDEVNYKEDFNVDGPLWIQVQALDKGLEIVVTKAQMHKNGENIELPINGEAIDLSVDEKMEQLLESKFGKSLSGEEEENEEEEEDDNVWVVINFNDFEDVIQLSYYLERCEETFNTILYHYEDQYFLYAEFKSDEIEEEVRENIISQLFEFGNDSNVMWFVLEEYAKKVFENDVFQKVRKHFPVN